MLVDIALRSIVTLLPRFSYRFGNEVELHDCIAQVLADGGITFTREHIAGPWDRFDFLCSPGIVIEAKVHGSLSPALGQCVRYAKHDDVQAVVLATTRFWGSATLGDSDCSFNGKPIRMVQLRGQSF